MSFSIFQNVNKLMGLPTGSQFAQSGVDNVDDGKNSESLLSSPWIIDPAVSYVDYDCWIEAELDAGMVLHKPLPQSATPVDTLASGFVDDPNLNKIKDQGVNLKSQGNFTDVIQRMATSTYIFKLRGYGLRVGYKIPIPGLRSVAGQTPIPAEVQMAYNRVVGNFSGVPVFFARWELWYYVTLPVHGTEVPPPNLALHIRGDAVPPTADGIAFPEAPADWNSVAEMPSPPDLQGGTTVGPGNPPLTGGVSQ